MSKEIVEKIKRYCAYQERCGQDIWCKLKEWKVEDKEIQKIINELIKEEYINEERFAKAFVRGKFNIKSWGNQKIIAELKRRNISDFCIKEAIKEIDTTLYKEKLDKLARKWLNEHKQLTEQEEREKLYRFLFSKGYEQDDILNFINKNNHK
jgi:regulatory protein